MGTTDREGPEDAEEQVAAMGWMGPNGWMSPWLMVLTFSGTLLMWAVVALVIARLLRPPPRHGPEAPPLRTLDERLARGEITIAQYRARRRRLVDGH